MTAEFVLPSVIGDREMPFPEEWVESDKRWRLDLSMASLRVIPDEVLKLEHLHELLLNTSKISGTLSRSILRLSNLTHLHLGCHTIRLHSAGQQYEGLSEFPSLVTEFQHLKSLSVVSQKRIKSIPDGICSQLNRLESFTLKGCNVDVLPGDFGEMKELQHLNVIGSPVANLTVAIGGLPKLHHVEMEIHKLEGFLETATDHTVRLISKLRAAPDKPTAVTFELKRPSVPHQITRLEKLVDFNISYLAIRVLCPELAFLKQLEVLQYASVFDCEISASSEFSFLQSFGISSVPRLTSGINIFPLIRHHLLKAAERHCSLLMPPLEVLQSGQHAVDSYFEILETTAVDRQKRGKLILSGKRLAGKTSLANSLQYLVSHSIIDIECLGSCLTSIEDRSVQHQLQLDDVNMQFLDVGGHEAYALTNQLIVSDNSINIVAVDSTMYETTDTSFHDNAGRFLHSIFDLLLNALVLLVFTKADKCDQSRLDQMTKHVEQMVKQLVDDRKQSMNQDGITIRMPVFVTSSQDLQGVPELLEVLRNVVTSPAFLPIVERQVPQTWVHVEDMLCQTKKPIRYLTEVEGMMTASSGQREHAPSVLSYLFKVGSVLYYPKIPCLRQYAFTDFRLVVDFVKHLYRHDMINLTLREAEGGHASGVTDMEFNQMKKNLTENGTVRLKFLRLLWAKFQLEEDVREEWYDILLVMHLEFDLAYITKCDNEMMSNRIYRAVEKGTMPLHGLPFQRFCYPRDPSIGLFQRLEKSDGELLLPWFVPQVKPAKVPDLAHGNENGDTCVRAVVTFGFRRSVPTGIFEKLSAKCHRHCDYVVHWRSGLHFIYGPVQAVFESTGPVQSPPAITLAFQVQNSGSNVKRMCHVLWRCAQDMESLLSHLPGVVVSRYISSKSVTESEVNVRARRPPFQPLSHSPSPSYRVLTDDAHTSRNSQLEDLLEDLRQVANDTLVSLPLYQVLSARTAKWLDNRKLKAVAGDIQDKWLQLAVALDLNKEELRELSQCVDVLQPWEMLKMWREHQGDRAIACVLYDALDSVGLQAVADKHFDPRPRQYWDRIRKPEIEWGDSMTNEMSGKASDIVHFDLRRESNEYLQSLCDGMIRPHWQDQAETQSKRIIEKERRAENFRRKISEYKSKVRSARNTVARKMRKTSQLRDRKENDDDRPKTSLGMTKATKENTQTRSVKGLLSSDATDRQTTVAENQSHSRASSRQTSIACRKRKVQSQKLRDRAVASQEGQPSPKSARIVEKEDNSKLIGAIVKHGQAQWFGYGIRLGFSKAEIDSICFDKPLMTDKLLAIILRKEDSDGKDGREILLEACRHVAHPFYGAVMDELGECRH